MAERGSFSESGEMDLLVLLPDGRSVTRAVHSNCPMMDLLIQITSKENLKPSAYVIEPLLSSHDDEDDYSTRPIITYKPNTPIGMLNTQVIRLALKSSNGTKMPPTNAVGVGNSYERRMSHSESFSHRVQNFNKLSGHSAVEICNDPDGFNKLSQETKKIKSRSNYITSALPPQVTSYDSTKQLMNTFRLQIHLPLEQLHVIRASPDSTIRDLLDIIQDERGLKLERYLVLKTNEPDLQLNLQGTLKEYAITELTLKLKPEFDVVRNNVNANPKKVKKENSSHFRSAFKSFFHQLKPSSRSNSVTELRHTTDALRPKSEIPSVAVTNRTEFAKPKAPPRKRNHAPPPPLQTAARVSNTLPLTRSHTVSESSCESTGEGSVGGSAPATLPRRCRLGPESVSTTNLAIEPPLPALRRGVSDLAVNKPKYPRRKRLAPRPPTLVSNEELKEDRIEELAVSKAQINKEEIISSHQKMHTEEPTEVNYDIEEIVQNDRVAYINGYEKNVSPELENKQQNGSSIPNKIKNQDQVEDELFEKAPPLALPVEQQLPDNENEIEDDLVPKVESVQEIQNLTRKKPPATVQQEEQNIFEYKQAPAVFTQQISNGKRLVVVDINIDDPNDPNDLDPCKDNTTSFESSDNIISCVATTHIANDDKVYNAVKSNIAVKAEIHSQHNNLSEKEEARFADEENIEFRHPHIASQIASSQNVEPLPAVEMPEQKVLPSFPRTVTNVYNHQSCTLPSLKLNENCNKNLPQRSISTGSTGASKPTVEDLLKQIEKIKQKNMKNNQIDAQTIVPPIFEKQNGHYQPEIVGLVEKKKSPIETEQDFEKGIPVDIPNEFFTKRDLFEKPRENGAVVKCATPPVSPEFEHPPLNAYTDEGKSRLITDVVAQLNLVEKQVSPEPIFKMRPPPSFMLTSWVEEKRLPVVNRIADYGSRSSVKVPVLDDSRKRESSVENNLPSALAATLPKPFTKSIETEQKKSSTIKRPPTIINVLEKSEVQTHKEHLSNVGNGRQSVYAKLNLYNMTPKIIVDSYPLSVDAPPVHKSSWELVQDASKKFQENKIYSEQEIDINDNHQNKENGHYTDENKIMEEHPYQNGTAKESDSRHVYKYPKPLQFQLGTWNDKAKGLKIEADAKLEKKSDPPLVKKIDEVAVWSTTY